MNLRSTRRPLLLPTILALVLVLAALGPRTAQALQAGEPASFTPDRTLILDSSTGQLSLVYAQQRHALAGQAVLALLGLSGARATVLTATQVAALAAGTPLTVRNAPVSLGTSPVAGGTPVLALGQPSALPGTDLPVIGSGFAPNEQVRLSIDPSGKGQTVTAGADGSFVATFAIPAQQLAGTSRLFAYGPLSKALEVEPLKVVAPAPQLRADVTAVHPGGVVHLSGSGFGPRETVSIAFEHGGAGISTRTNAAGTFTATLPVPATLPPGKAIVYALGATSHRRATLTLAVGAAGGKTAEQTATTTATATATGTPPPSSSTGTASATVTATATSTGTPTATPMHTRTPSPTATDTRVPTATPTPTATHTAVPTRTPSATRTQTPSPTHTPTRTPTLSPVPSATREPSFTRTPSATPTASPTRTPTHTATPRPSATSTATRTATLTATRTASPSPTRTPQPTTTPLPARLSLTVSPGTARPGDGLAFSGTGFAAGELVLIRLNPVAILTVRANSGGAFVHVPYVLGASFAPAIYAVSASGVSTGRSATTSLTVLPSVVPGGQLPNGTLLRDVGTGRVYLIYNGVRHWITSQATFDALGYDKARVIDASSGFVQSIPQGAGIALRQVQSLTLPTSPITTGNASITLSRPSASPAGSLSVTGQGYKPHEPVTVTFAGTATSVTAGTDGSFTLPLAVPAAAAIGSTVRVYAYGTQSTVLTLAPVAVIGQFAQPQLAASPGSAVLGSELRVSGQGFLPNEGVNIFLANGVGLTTTADARGTIGVTLTVPLALATGQQPLIAYGLGSKQFVSITVTLLAPPPAAAHISLSSTVVGIGSLVLVSGSGFMAGEPVQISIAGKAVILVAAPDGSFRNAGFTVPAGTPAGLNAVVAQGQTSRRIAVAGLQVVVYNPSVAISPSNTTPGAVVIVTGQGYAPGETITLALNGQALATVPSSIITTASGTFAASLSVPGTALGGTNGLIASGSRSRASASASLLVNLPVQSTWYFAGGDTSPGYSTQIALVNPNAQPATVNLSFMFTSGAPRAYSTVVAANSRATVDVGSIVGPGQTVFTMLNSDRKIGAEETVYRPGADFSQTIGSSAPLRTWYLAEGYTGLSFHEYVRIFNPGDTVAHADLRLLPFNGQPATAVPQTIGPRSGVVVDVRAIAPNLSLSAIVDSDAPVVVDRLITFGPGGYGATEQVGSATPSSTWLFAEGSTVNNFETYFTVLNPDPQRPAVVTGTFFDQAGNVLGNSTIVVNPLRRGNIKLNALVRSSGIATILTSSVPVLVERPLYFGSPNGGAGAGGSDVFGRNGGGTSWLFPEGNTAGSFREFLLLQNPGGLAAEVRVRFYGTAGQVVDRTLTLVPRSRFTLDVLRDVGALGAGQHSSLVTSTNGVPIIVEQSIYSDNFTRGDGVAGIAQ